MCLSPLQIQFGQLAHSANALAQQYLGRSAPPSIVKIDFVIKVIIENNAARRPRRLRRNAEPTNPEDDMLKTGEEHIQTLRDGRAIYLHGRRVEDASVHPAYRNAIRSVAKLYDFQSAPNNRELMTFTTQTGGVANRV
jgi:hypothetical protein